MAKKKAKGKAVPQTIAGVKLPKKLRKSGGSLAALIASPMARELLADAMIAVAGALVANKRTRTAAVNAGADVAQAGAQAGSAAVGAAQTATGAVAEVVTDAARRILPASLTGGETDDRRSDPDAGRYGYMADAQVGKKRKKDRDKHKGH